MRTYKMKTILCDIVKKK